MQNGCILSCTYSTDSGIIAFITYINNNFINEWLLMSCICQLQRYDSYSIAETKVTMMLGAIHHLNNIPTDGTILDSSVIKMWTELGYFVHSLKMTQKTFSFMYHITNNAHLIHTLMSI